MTPPAPSFTQVASLALYALSSMGEPDLTGFWAGYRPSAHAAFEGSATLDQAWQDQGGSYVFLGRTPADLAAFSAQLDDLLARLSPTGLIRVVWIADPTVPLGNWQLATLAASATGSGSSIAWTVARPSVLAVGEYAVELPVGAALTQPDPVEVGWGIAAGALELLGPQATCASVAGTAWLPLAGPSLGSWRAQVTLPASGADGLAELGVLIRYAAPFRDGAPGDAVDTLEMPVIVQGAAALTLHVAFDWLFPLNAERTRVGFFADDGSGPAIGPLAATLRTNRGYATTLTPRAYGAPLHPARLVLCHTPATVDKDPQSTTWSYHLAPDGAFDLAVIPPSNPGTDTRNGVMFGLSGLEYAALQQGAGAVVYFQAGLPAFAPAAAPEAPSNPPATGQALTGAATTAYLAILPATAGAGLAYYAQPRQAPLYSAGGGLGSGFLGYLELIAARLPEWSATATVPPPVIPAAPLAGVSPSDGALARRIEQAALAPARRRAIGLAPEGLGAAADNGTTAVTPQGLLVEAGTEDIERVVVASMPDTSELELDLTKVGPHLRGAIQANELFFVVGDPAAYMNDSSVRYRLDATGLIVAQSLGVPRTVIEALRPIVLPGGVPRVFAQESEFDTAVSTVAGSYLELLRKIAGFLRAVLSGWTFQLSPRSWRTGADDPTIMLFKFCNRSLADLVQDGSAWSWREAAGGKAQQVLEATVESARKHFEDTADDPYAAFYRDVLADRDWNGVLFLNAPVSISELPPELQFMAAGISAERFYAHHIGFSATPVEVDGATIAIRQTAAFGLIDYQDPADLVLDPSNPNPDFGFKTLTLTARFANAALSGFHARVELMVNRLLGAPLTKLDPTHGNNMLLTGSSQRQGGTLSYAFVLEGEHRYAANRTVLDSVEIDTLRVLTTAGRQGAGEVVSTFALGGFLRFVDDPTFDAFGYGNAAVVPDLLLDGRLRFDELAVEMRFPLGAAGSKTFGVTLDGIRLDTTRSEARKRSLIHNFPVALAGLVSSLHPAAAGDRIHLDIGASGPEPAAAAVVRA